jgi:hypothetical protein
MTMTTDTCASCAECRHRAVTAERELAEFKERVRERMIEEAERRDWCSEFDAILAEFGLRGRTRNWDVTLTITGSVTMTLLARDEDHAQQLAENALASYGSIGNYELSVDDVSCEGATPSDD